MLNVKESVEQHRHGDGCFLISQLTTRALGYQNQVSRLRESCWLSICYTNKYLTLLHKGNQVKEIEALSICEGLSVLQSIISLLSNKAKTFQKQNQTTETSPDKLKGLA